MPNATKTTKPAKSTLAETSNNLSAAAREKSTRLLNQTLADLIDLHFQAKYAHWNVCGPTFFAQHELFDKLAGEFFEPIDDVAERIVALGGIANGKIHQAASVSQVPPVDVPKGELGWINTLIKQTATIANAVRSAIDATAEGGDTGTSDLLTGLSRSLDKSLWFLEAHTRGN
ncbi:MAG: DNA starvation/stationary phase protection protein Dps [Puniceicoccales bacterium]|jgi:starvation-inducible DNA-binding protein|nr:DNA starvation/stationary phase protection protein Dps [Puniceicoccales bacterium]